jgi:hypothetical protein
VRYQKAKLFILVLFFSSLLMAPQAATRIRGRVTDSEGAPIPGAVVTLTGGAMSPRSMVTLEDGTYTFLSVPPGEYSIKVELIGFYIKEIHNIRVSINQAAVINVLLDEQGTKIILPPPPPEEKPISAQEQLFSNELDVLVKQLPLGQVEYNPPTEMIEQSMERVEVKISQSLTEDLTEGLKGRGIPEVEKILVSSTMKATLSGKDFEISALSEPVQSVFSTGSTLWEWNVLPLKPGEKFLYVSVAVIFDTKYGEKAKSYPAMDRKIAVKVNPIIHPFDWIQFFKNVAVVLGIIATLIGIVTALKKARKKKRAGAHKY